MSKYVSVKRVGQVLGRELTVKIHASSQVKIINRQTYISKDDIRNFITKGASNERNG